MASRWAIVLLLIAQPALTSEPPTASVVHTAPDLPPGWINAYDPARQALSEYLLEQAQAGLVRNEDVYAYVYADWCTGCLRFREQAHHGYLRKLLAGRRIVMLRFEDVVDQLPTGLRQYVPLLIRLDQNGALGDATLPDQVGEGPAARQWRALADFLNDNPQQHGGKEKG